MILKNWNSVDREARHHVASLARDAERGRQYAARVRRFVGRMLRRWGDRLDPSPITDAPRVHGSSVQASPGPKEAVEPPTI